MKALGLLCEYRQKAKHCVSSLKQRYFFTSPMYEKKIKDLILRIENLLVLQAIKLSRRQAALHDIS